MNTNNTPTPHIGAKYGEIAETVIMAGDPLRARFMAEKYLENPVCINEVRGMLGFTGTYNKNLHLGDLVLAEGACTDSNYADQYELDGMFAPIGDFELLCKAANTCEKMGLNYMVGNVVSSDLFYRENPNTKGWIKMGVLAVEMEVAALYMNAARSGNRALGILTISDHILTGEKTTSEQRQKTFTDMMEVALSLV